MKDNNIAEITAPPTAIAGLSADADILESAIYYRLFYDAETVRWKMSEIPWLNIDKSRITPSLVNLVTEIAFAELTTWSATHRFFQAFTGDVDFTQWITVWLYEETKHPQVLMRWLKEAGQTFDADFLIEGRKTHPFMDSQMGTLVMNVLSEIEASSLYLGLSSVVEEPVLKLIAKNLSADEARHASGFYSYAKKMLDNSDNPDIERLQAIKVLYLWLMDKKKVKHPVALLTNRVSDQEEFGAYSPELGFGTEKVHSKMRKMIGQLIGRPLESKAQVSDTFTELYATVKSLTN
ncbi:MAG: ferritin-like domain-containing protein [Blastocatellia bacterium]